MSVKRSSRSFPGNALYSVSVLIISFAAAFVLTWVRCGEAGEALKTIGLLFTGGADIVFENGKTVFEISFSSLCLYLSNAACILVFSLAFALPLRYGCLNTALSAQVFAGLSLSLLTGKAAAGAGLGEWAVLAAMLCACGAAGLLCGLLSSLFKTVFRSSDFMSGIVLSVIFVLVFGAVDLGEVPTCSGLIDSSLFVLCCFALLLAILLWVLFSFTKTGFEAKCIRENTEASLFAGLRVNKKRMTAYTLAGLFAAFPAALILLKMQAAAGDPADIGLYLIPVLAGTAACLLADGNILFCILFSLLNAIFCRGSLNICREAEEPDEVRTIVLLTVFLVTIAAGLVRKPVLGFFCKKRSKTE